MGLFDFKDGKSNLFITDIGTHYHKNNRIFFIPKQAF